jgi:hypothetical protein
MQHNIYIFNINLYIKNRIFEISTDFKKIWKFTNDFNTISEMTENKEVKEHVFKVFRTLDKIVILLTKSAVSEQDKKKLFELGKRHYHYGLKKEYFKVIEF